MMPLLNIRTHIRVLILSAPNKFHIQHNNVFATETIRIGICIEQLSVPTANQIKDYENKYDINDIHLYPIRLTENISMMDTTNNIVFLSNRIINNACYICSV